MAYSLAFVVPAAAAQTDPDQLVAEFQGITGNVSATLPAPTPILQNGGGTYYFWALSGGLHLFYTMAVPTSFIGCVRFRYGGLSGAYLSAAIPLNPQETENPDAKTSTRASAADWTPTRAAKLDLIGAGATLVQSALSEDGTIMTVIRGDSYQQVEAEHPFMWVDTSDHFAGLPLASWHWEASGGLQRTGIPTTQDGHKAVVLELAAAETAALVGIEQRWALYFLLDDGEPVTWQRIGRLLLQDRL